MATTVQSSTGTTIPLTLTDEQKQFLYDQGYIILKGVVDKKITSAAKARIKLASENQKKGGRREDLGITEEMTNLVNASAITPILNSLIGKFDPPKNAQVGVIGCYGLSQERFTILWQSNSYGWCCYDIFTYTTRSKRSRRYDR